MSRYEVGFRENEFFVVWLLGPELWHGVQLTDKVAFCGVGIDAMYSKSWLIYVATSGKLCTPE